MDDLQLPELKQNGSFSNRPITPPKLTIYNDIVSLGGIALA